MRQRVILLHCAGDPMPPVSQNTAGTVPSAYDRDNTRSLIPNWWYP